MQIKNETDLYIFIAQGQKMKERGGVPVEIIWPLTHPDDTNHRLDRQCCG